MFKEHIAWARNMIRKLEAERNLAPMDREALPDHVRVTAKESMAWRKMVENKIQSEFGQDTLARYQVNWEIYKDEIDRNNGDEYSRQLNALYRIVNLLEELGCRAKANQSNIAPLKNTEQ